jgi:hypothetical protein
MTADIRQEVSYSLVVGRVAYKSTPQQDTALRNISQSLGLGLIFGTVQGLGTGNEIWQLEGKKRDGSGP